MVFDYGDWDTPTKQPHPDPAPAEQQELFGPDPSMSADDNPVPIREDCFSSFRAGFEIRTLRRCRRVLMFHHFAELGAPTLVRSTDFTYHNNPENRVSFLTAVTVTGHQKDAAGIYQSASMPPVTFAYTEFRPQEQRYQSIVANGNDMPPQALNNPDFALVDLFGDGLPDVLHSGPAGFRYWRNLGGGAVGSTPRHGPDSGRHRARSARSGVRRHGRGRPGRSVGAFRSTRGFLRDHLRRHLADVQPYDVVSQFRSWPIRTCALVDLTGDGLADALMTRDQHFLWFECLGGKGSPRRSASRAATTSTPSPMSFSTIRAGRVRLADMTGDGLTDIVLVHNGRIDYWPNLGYGRFGKRITMAQRPRLDADFEPKRLFLADLNGTGCADLVYVGRRTRRISGSTSPATVERAAHHSRHPTAPATSTPSSSPTSSAPARRTCCGATDFAGDASGNYKALDFCGGIKPYVLAEMSNNMGATTGVSYAPSTKYFLQDQASGAAVGHQAAVPGPGRRAKSRSSITSADQTGHHVQLPPRLFRRAGARVPRLRPRRSVRHRTSDHRRCDGTMPDSATQCPTSDLRWRPAPGFTPASTSTIAGATVCDYRELTDRFRQEYYQADTEAVPSDEHDVGPGADAGRGLPRATRGAGAHRGLRP